mgnify:CR=1 FL=1
MYIITQILIQSLINQMVVVVLTKHKLLLMEFHGHQKMLFILEQGILKHHGIRKLMEVVLNIH